MKTFLFTLKNPHGLDPIRFGLKAGGSNAIYCKSDRLAFGYAHDLCVWNNCDQNTASYTNIRNSFENDTGIGSTVLFDGASNSTVEELEVLAVIQ
jgi:hypothetical protein